MKNIFMEKKFLEYRLNGFLVSFQLEVNEIVPPEAEKGEEYVLIDEGKTKYADRAGRSTEKKNKGKIDEEVQQSNEKLLKRLSKVELKFVQSNDLILRRISDLEVRIQSNPTENWLKDVEERVKTNEKVMEHLQILERKVKKMLAGDEGQMKDGVESLFDETDQVYNDFPSFSLGIEFELSCGEKDVEVPVRKSDKTVEKSLRAVVKSEKAVEMNLNEEIESHEDDWLRVDDIVARSLAKNQEDVVSPSNKGIIELLDDVELKDDVWEKVVEVTAGVGAETETEIEEENVETIDIDDVTPDMHLKRQKKPGVLL
ncbi:Hypothetical predicted protein [Olea europaea subsp. europaea]|uniref:Uncharacterized protein n=1 Tax=Olea europaea subsp. europaea TaxID=158383 RepID=A0A8S0S0U2_OLEEU|nr:Hypothetical predicted protein [Olea europaea subsp. europaea]